MRGDSQPTVLQTLLLRQLSVSVQAVPTFAMLRTCGQLATTVALNNAENSFWLGEL